MRPPFEGPALLGLLLGLLARPGPVEAQPPTSVDIPDMTRVIEAAEPPGPDAPPDPDAPSAAPETSAAPPAWRAHLGDLVPAAAGPPPRVRAVRFADSRPPTPEARVALDALVGQRATPEALDDLVRALADPDAPGLDLRQEPTDDPGVIDVVVIGEARLRRVGRMRPTTAPIGAPDPEGARRLMRRIEGIVSPFALEEGQVFHPWFERRDTARIRRYFIEQGHPFARVVARRFETPGVVDITWRVTPGPALAVGEVSLAGLPDLAAAPALRTAAGQPARPWVIAGDIERLRGHVCRAGFPEARVSVEAALGRRALGIEFVVEPGPARRIRSLAVEAPTLPATILTDLPVADGGPWCPDRAAAAAAAIRDRLEAAGRPDADVQWTAEPTDGGIALTLRIADARAVRIGRVWFAGNRVTRVDLLRELITVRPGDLYDPEAIEDSVQALRRTALFRRVEARTVPGPHPGVRHLVFTLLEREPFSIDLSRQSLTLHNLDLADTTTDVRALRAGAALRGAGQRLVLYAQPDWQGLHLFDPYVLPILGVEGRLDRRTRTFGADVEETWYALQGEAGLRLLDDRLLILPGLMGELTFPEGVSSSAGLPVADDTTALVAAGLRMRARFERLDDERVPYLGLRVEGHIWRALPWLGSDLDLTRWRAALDLRLPLARFEGDRHLVLGLSVGGGDITRHNDRALAAHHRLTPKIRGYESLRFRHPVGEELLEIGGQSALTAAVELRVPMPYARRHALVPFVDGAALGDRGVPLFDELFGAPGLTYVYSFFDERLEGYLRVAFPLRTDVDLEYVGFGMDGSF